MNINKKHLLKYLIQFIIISLTAYCISPCNLKTSFAVIIGILSASIFALLDTFYPMIVHRDKK